MLIIPAIDLKNGFCVRLLQGKKEEVTTYSDDPVSIALKWQSCGAKLLHIIDLDGAFSGSQKNFQSILNIRKAVDMLIQVGGGIRDLQSIDSLISSGVHRVILGTVAIENPKLVKEAVKNYPGRILVSIDAKDSKVAIRGWVQSTKVEAIELALRMQDYGVAGLVYTDISRDGMLTGPNIEAIQEIVNISEIPVIASGGVSSIDDLKKLSEITKLWGVIIGKALYSGKINLKEAVDLIT
ncbi:MAG: 1-(5-phosphoribosyl)-5-[(5-phosphoribosylamino)methylideneamino]imidazole-4-carboxamide isomerase [Thermodesulfovibrionales bacterium]|nr:1-(5-phosphoribosyl)-5-[(5-phosphoribosylamino)methylideneamino]imidazole-4-carboxamide isomerase [Thermodesulfovibrionales bacterium]